METFSVWISILTQLQGSGFRFYSNADFWGDHLYRRIREGLGKRFSEAIEIAGITLEPTFHYLTVRSWLETLTAALAELANYSTQIDELRLETNIHVSLAYGFEPQQEKRLQDIAGELDWQVSVGWEMRFYERHSLPDRSNPVSRQEDLNLR